MKAHVLGFPRIGPRRELKTALEKFWSEQSSESELIESARDIRLANWELQNTAGLDMVAVGDFSLYDHVLDHMVLFNLIPPRYVDDPQAQTPLDLYFAMARGTKKSVACEMTKWFDTNYHYIVPELNETTQITLNEDAPLFTYIKEASAEGYTPKVVLLGPVSLLSLSRHTGHGEVKNFLVDLTQQYRVLLEKLAQMGVKWVQIDEPILVTDVDSSVQKDMQAVYESLAGRGVNILLCSYFGPQRQNLEWSKNLPVEGLHLDLVMGAEDLNALQDFPEEKILSAGLVAGRSIWRKDLQKTVTELSRTGGLADRLGDRLWIASSCSFMHLPVDIDQEKKLTEEIKSWMAFAKQKLLEVVTIKKLLANPSDSEAAAFAEESARVVRDKARSKLVARPAVQATVAALKESDETRTPFNVRVQKQREALHLPVLPTTTIGSFPQTPEVRSVRAKWNAGKVDDASYEATMQEFIREVIKEQEDLGIDVLVHGEPERNDMVEYFAGMLEGMATTSFGWIQSYGSRCVKPPILYGDINHSGESTAPWINYAQSQTKKWVKGMLTGPVTILRWSLFRDDISQEDIALQIAVALREEVRRLEETGTAVIQVDEPAIREGAPIRRSDWGHYYNWATRAFRISTSSVKDETQIHTHMCYSEFNEIIEEIAAMDADVVSIETSRSDMQLLDAFKSFEYPNEIGPGVYDIHSPRVPDVADMQTLLTAALKHIAAEQLWVNPDCGLKTRKWPEVRAALSNMVTAANQVRSSL